MRAIDGYKGKSQIVHCALRLLPLVFVRSAELRYARWDEFELANATWKIPAERMKMKIAHIVPLSTQSLTVLNELHKLTCPGGYLFPSIRSYHQPISNNTVNAALRRRFPGRSVRVQSQLTGEWGHLVYGAGNRTSAAV
jgi:integrase